MLLFLLHMLYILLFFETYCHIFMVINTKLVIGHHILKNIPVQNRPNYTALMTIKLRCSTVLKMAKNCTKPHHKHP